MGDLEEIVTKDLEKDLDFVSLYSIGTGHKGFERQPSYLEIFSNIESKDPFGTFNETTMFFSAKETNVVVVKEERTSRLTGYTHYSPSSPTDSWISTDDFPAELDELNEQFEIQLVDKIQLAGEQVDATVAFQESEEEKEEVSDDSDEDYVPEYTKPAKRKRASQILRKDADDHDDLSSDSDPDFDPEEFEEVVRPSKRRRKQKEKTSDYESEEFSEEEKPQRNPAPRRYRRPSKNPVPQQWAVEKKNPAMNYEKLSRAMRYYYRNKEIEMVKGERLTYKFGPNMRDFRAKDRNDPNFQLRA